MLCDLRGREVEVLLDVLPRRSSREATGAWRVLCRLHLGRDTELATDSVLEERGGESVVGLPVDVLGLGADPVGLGLDRRDRLRELAGRAPAGGADPGHQPGAASPGGVRRRRVELLVRGVEPRQETLEPAGLLEQLVGLHVEVSDGLGETVAVAGVHL